MNSYQKKSILLKILISFSFLISSLSFALPLPASLPSLKDKVGQARLLESHYKNDFFATLQFYVSQKNLTFCGVASSAIVLNSLGKKAPLDENLKKYYQFTQDNIFNVITPANDVQQNKVLNAGMSLNQAAELLRENGASVEIHHLENQPFDNVKNNLLSVLSNSKQYVITNYDRRSLQLPGGGHFSPIVAYHAPSDSFLLLEVSRYKYPPFWVKAKSLYQAMRTTDGTQNRGYLIVK